LHRLVLIFYVKEEGKGFPWGRKKWNELLLEGEIVVGGRNTYGVKR